MEISMMIKMGLVFWGCITAYLFWMIKRYQTKVDDLEHRVTKIETLMELLGDISKDIGTVKTDVAVIKSKVN